MFASRRSIPSTKSLLRQTQRRFDSHAAHDHHHHHHHAESANVTLNVSPAFSGTWQRHAPVSIQLDPACLCLPSIALSGHCSNGNIYFRKVSTLPWPPCPSGWSYITSPPQTPVALQLSPVSSTSSFPKTNPSGSAITPFTARLLNKPPPIETSSTASPAPSPLTCLPPSQSSPALFIT